MALHLPNQDADATANHGDDLPMKTEAVIADDIDQDELFDQDDIDIALLDGRGDGHGHHRRSHSAAADDAGHALLANCLLPVQSVSSALPVPASSVLSPLYHPYSGYYSSRRLFFTGGDSRRFLGRRSAGSSARFCFSIRGFEIMGSYFQRY